MPFPVAEKYIQETEEKLGVTFPEAFHQGMCEKNGGKVDDGSEVWQLFPVFDSSDEVRIKRTTNDIARETEAARRRTGYPDAAVAIGSNGSGDLLLMLPDKEDSSKLEDKVYLWDHQTRKTRVAFSTGGILMKIRD